VGDHHVDRPEVYARQRVQLTGTNRPRAWIPRTLVFAMEFSRGHPSRAGRSLTRARAPATTDFGGYRDRVTPVPIPNTEVKPASADGTWVDSPWESRTPPDFSREDPIVAIGSSRRFGARSSCRRAVSSSGRCKGGRRPRGCVPTEAGRAGPSLGSTLHAHAPSSPPFRRFPASVTSRRRRFGLGRALVGRSQARPEGGRFGRPATRGRRACRLASRPISRIIPPGGITRRFGRRALGRSPRARRGTQPAP
jgi:hypothetical protein